MNYYNIFKTIRHNKPNYYTYVFRDNDNNIIYVGKGTGNRCYAKRRNIKQEYTVDIISDGLTNSESLELERLIINTIGIENLLNNI